MMSKVTGIKVPDLHQIGIVCRDIEQVARNYWYILGIGPWDVLYLPPPHGYDLTLHGKPAYYELRVALAQPGEVQLELVETLQGPTGGDEFMAVHGEGINHVQYSARNLDEIDKYLEIMEKNGYPFYQGNRFGDNGRAAYFDTRQPLKTLWEAIVMPSKFGGPSYKFPPDAGEVSPSRIKAGAITKVGLTVKNLDMTAENYRNILGIGPWEIFEVSPPTLRDGAYHGKPASQAMRIGRAMVGPMQLELVQPVTGDTFFFDFLCKHGEGISHIGSEVASVSETTRVMAEVGFTTLQSGTLGDGAFAIYDTITPLKTAWEAYTPANTLSFEKRFP
jgi:methylmalonyl-CoA/ethylmalonyl-CoA epimerase